MNKKLDKSISKVVRDSTRLTSVKKSKKAEAEASAKKRLNEDVQKQLNDKLPGILGKKTKTNKSSAKNQNNTVKSKSQSNKSTKKNIDKSAEHSPSTANKKYKSKGKFSGNKAVVTSSPVRIISLGGLGEIGKNLYVYEYQNDLIIVDCGLAFPNDDLLGIDAVIPDFTYLAQNIEKIRGIFITHGHEDHIGGLTYLLKQINVPVYATALTIGLIKLKLEEAGLLKQAKLNTVKAGQTIKAGNLSVEFIHVTHSIPDACAFAITTPAGIILHTGDFKVDFTPIASQPIDLARFSELGNQGVLALLCDSTNAERAGSTPSESLVGESFEKLFSNAKKRRIIIATFASNVHRIQQIVDAAVRTKRKVCVLGRSMVNIVSVACELNYLTIPKGVQIDAAKLNDYTDEQVVLITTGSQGEQMSALTRMSSGEHKQVKITSNDYVIISAYPIPGNEKTVGNVVNELMKLGAEVIYEKMYEVHVSGHACQDEIKLLLSLVHPKFYIPMHGEYKQMVKNASVATSIGYNKDNIILAEIGQVIETNGDTIKINGSVPSGQLLVDGLGVGDVGKVVLHDRHLLAEEGLIVAIVVMDQASGELLKDPDLISRGFVYVKESEVIMSGAKNAVLSAVQKCQNDTSVDYNALRTSIKDELDNYIYSQTKRKPMILPVVEVV